MKDLRLEICPDEVIEELNTTIIKDFERLANNLSKLMDATEVLAKQCDKNRRINNNLLDQLLKRRDD